MSFVDNDKKIVWQNGATGGTPMSAENLNKVNEETSNAFDKMNSSVDSQIAGLKNSLVGSQATEVVKDAENVTKTLNGKPLTGNSGIFEDDGVTVKKATDAKNVSTSINNKLISDIFEDDGVTVKQATKAIKKNDGSFLGLTKDVETEILSSYDNNHQLLIPQKIKVWEGNSTTRINLSAFLKEGDIVEIHFKPFSTPDTYGMDAKIIQGVVGSSRGNWLDIKIPYDSPYVCGVYACSISFAPNLLGPVSEMVRIRVKEGTGGTNADVFQSSNPPMEKVYKIIY